MEEKQPIGRLFNSINIYDLNSVNLLLDNLTEEQAFYMIIQALQMANSQGIYSLQESEIVSKSLRILQKKEPPTEQ